MSETRPENCAMAYRNYAGDTESITTQAHLSMKDLYSPFGPPSPAATASITRCARPGSCSWIEQNLCKNQP